MSYYILLQDNRDPDFPEILESPENFKPEEWITGKEVSDPGYLKFKLPPDSTDSRGDIISGVVTLFHEDLVDTLKSNNISNIQYFPVELESSDGSIEDNYFLINIIGMVDALEHKTAIYEKSSTTKRLKSFYIDSEKAKGHDIFRIPEAPSLLIIDSSLKISLQIARLVGCILLPTNSYDELLEYAIEGNNIHSVKDLLKCGVDVNKRAFDYNKPYILTALKNRNSKIIETLLNSGADISSMLPNLEINKELEGSYILDCWDKQQLLDRELLEVVSSGEQEFTKELTAKIEILLKLGANPNWQDSNNKSCLPKVLKTWDKNSLNIIKLLVAHGADLNLRDNCRYPISNAFWARRNSEVIMKYFLDNGATRGIDSTLVTAIERNNIDVVKILIKYIENSDWCESEDKSYLGLCQSDSTGLEIASLLLQKSKNVNYVNNNYDLTPVESAIKNDFIELIELLLKHGAKLPESVKYARSSNMCKYLSGKGVSLSNLIELQDYENSYTQTPLIYHTSQEHEGVVKYLLESDIDLYEVDSNKCTALHVAFKYNPTSFLELMIPYFNIKRCNEINNFFKLDSYSSRGSELIKEKLNLSDENEVTIDISLFKKEICTDFVDKAEVVLKELKKKSMTREAQLALKLPDYNKIITKKQYDTIYAQLYKCLVNFDPESVQGIYMEHPGSVTTPFDPCGNIYVLKGCNGSLDLSNTLDEIGYINMESLFVGIDKLLEENDKLYNIVNDYFNFTAYRIINIIFGNIINDGKIKTSDFKKPFYFFAAEHNHDAKLIFEILE